MKIEEPHQEQLDYTLGLTNNPVKCGYELDLNGVKVGYIHDELRTGYYLIEDSATHQLFAAYINHIRWIDV